MALSFSILRLRDFRLLLSTRMLGTMALQAQAVIVGWQIYSLTHNPFLLGLTGLTEAVPAISCAMFAGHIVDSFRPHRVFIACIATLMFNMLLLFLFAGGVVPVPFGHVVDWIFFNVFVSGLARSFLMPSSFALQSQIIPPALISSAAAWLSSSFQIGVIVGPAAAGLIYGGYGVQIAWLIPLSLMSIEFIMAASISPNFRRYRATEKREPTVKSIKAGWRFIWQNNILLSVMLLDMFAVLFGGATAMLPVYADRILHVGSEGLGALRAAPALGAILTALVLAIKPFKKIRVALLLWMIVGFGLSIIGFGLSRVFAISIFFLVLSGAFDSISMVIRSTLVQVLTPYSMRGRVSSLSSIFIISSNEIGAFESGVATTLLGLVPSVVFGGVGTLIVVAIMTIAAPKLRTMIVRTDQAPKS